MVKKINTYTREENYCGYYSIIFLQDEGHICDIVIADNRELRSNKTSERKGSVLSSLHIGDKKYRLYSSKTETAKNITIQKMNERIESNSIFEVIYDEEAIHLIITIKYTVIVSDPRFPIINNPHSMSSLVFCKTMVRNYQLKTEAATYHYF